MSKLIRSVRLPIKTSRILWATCLSTTLISSIGYANTKYCLTETGNPYEYQYNFQFGSNQNSVGFTSPWRELSASGNYYVRGNCRTQDTTYWTAKPASSLSQAFIDNDGSIWHDINGNDYIQVASQIYIYNDKVGGSFHHVPFTNISNACGGKCGTGPAGSGSRSKLRLRIKQRFIGSSTITALPITSLYATQGTAGGVGARPMVTIKLSAQMTVPQNCKINAGQIIDIDFKTLSTQAFKDTPVGRKPLSIPSQQREFQVNCNGIDAQALLSVRIEASQVQNNIIMSNNPDVGFVIADKDNKELQPNNFASHIPFQLESNNNPNANITINAWPVSPTGQIPKSGPVKANGFLRVDFK